ncbi:MAG: LptF/LptG family permease, partial [Gemmatimonadaceae bacterium]|nr:LptF/LptG family permease [Gemmatimonadaceae bacterium]
RTPEPRGVGWVYCSLLSRLKLVKEVHAADLSGVVLHAVTDTMDKAGTVTPIPPTPTPQAPVTQPPAPAPTPTPAGGRPIAPSLLKPGALPGSLPQAVAPAVPGPPIPGPTVSPPVMIGQPVPGQQPGVAPVAQPGQVFVNGQLQQMPAAGAPPLTQAQIAAQAAAAMMKGVPSGAVNGAMNGAVNRAGETARAAEARLRLDIATLQRNRFDIEIHKKFSLAVACLIFVIVGAPIAVRFPSGGVGLVIGVSLVVFAVYYVGLIGGESLANKGIVPPFWAMWGTNVIMTLLGLVMLLRMGRDSNTGRGGSLGDRLYAWRLRRAARRDARALAHAPRTA